MTEKPEAVVGREWETVNAGEALHREWLDKNPGAVLGLEGM